MQTVLAWHGRFAGDTTFYFKVPLRKRSLLKRLRKGAAQYGRYAYAPHINI
jgi:hypothetical protein